MTTGIKLNEATKERLKILGNKIDRSPHWIMRTAIEKYLTEEEKSLQERQEDHQRWEDYVLTGQAIAHEDVMQWLDSIGTKNEKSCPG